MNGMFASFQVQSKSCEVLIFPEMAWQVDVHSVPPGSGGGLKGLIVCH
jgi:hypothetical protein